MILVNKFRKKILITKKKSNEENTNLDHSNTTGSFTLTYNTSSKPSKSQEPTISKDSESNPHVKGNVKMKEAENKEKILRKEIMTPKESNERVSLSPYIQYIYADEDVDKGTDTSLLTESRLTLYFQNLRLNIKTIKKASVLKYREEVFRAASRLMEEMPPYPDWAYINKNLINLDIQRINVGGYIFIIFKDILVMWSHTKLARCLLNRHSQDIPFFDRDHNCFKSVINFFRTGRLHVAPNICWTFFEQELKFWEVNLNNLEPCCWSEYRPIKCVGESLKKYAEDQEKDENFDEFNKTACLNLRMKIYKTLVSGSGSVMSRWVSATLGFFIVSSVLVMVISTTPLVRIDIKTNTPAVYEGNEKITDFLTRTKVKFSVKLFESTISGFFLAELFLRIVLCPNRLELFSDSLNWIDLLATTTTLLSNTFTRDESSGSYKGYMFLLKVPRIFRLFKLTRRLKNGIDALSLTIRAGSNEMKLIILLIVILTAFFGSLIFVIEMVNENTERYDGKKSSFSNIYLGMWWAIVTMGTIGFGDYFPITFLGYILGSVTIMCGILVFQLPMAIALKNFSLYSNEAKAILNRKKINFTNFIYKKSVDVNFLNKKRTSIKRTLSAAKFRKLFVKEKLIF